MHELFHTEDCGLSLICRCCRGSVCEQRLSRAERMRVQRELWMNYSRTSEGFATKSWRRYLKNVAGCFARGMIKRIARWALTGPENREASPTKKTVETTTWRTSMKTIGIVGGMSWESSAEYYRLINEKVKAALGPAHSAELVMYSLDFHPVAQLELEERWAELATILIAAITRLEKAGAKFVIMASNTAHKVTELMRPSIHIPLLHIADATAEEIGKTGISTVGLLGTRFVMEQDFYKDHLRAQGINVLVPDQAQREYVHNVIYDELCAGKLIPESREQLRTIILDLQRAGAEGVVLACTELPLLIHVEDSPVRLFDTMTVHVNKAVLWTLAR
jgi:amino-acid racemase